MKCFTGIASVFFLLALVVCAGCGRSPLPGRVEAEQRLQAVLGQERFYRDMTPSPDGRTLWYVSCTEEGRRLFSLDLSNSTTDRDIASISIRMEKYLSLEG